MTSEDSTMPDYENQVSILEERLESSHNQQDALTVRNTQLQLMVDSLEYNVQQLESRHIQDMEVYKGMCIGKRIITGRVNKALNILKGIKDDSDTTEES